MNNEIKTEVIREDQVKKANKKVASSLVVAIFSLLFLIVDLIMYANMLGFFLACFSFVLTTQAKKQGATNIKNLKIARVMSIIAIVYQILKVFVTFILLYINQ